MKERELEKFTQSYVYRDNGDRFFVSTMYRQSSAALNPDGWYYETLAWRLDNEGGRLEIVADNSGASFWEHALEQHTEVVKQLHEKGTFTIEDLTG